MKIDGYTYYYAKFEGRQITGATKKKALMKFAATVRIPGADGVGLLDLFQTERKARNFAEREGWPAHCVVIVEVSPDKPSDW
jgi:hypothetical protein